MPPGPYLGSLPASVGASRSRSRDVGFLRARTDRRTKITLPGPFTMAQQASNEAYDDPEELVMDLAAAVNAEARALEAAGADVIHELAFAKLRALSAGAALVRREIS